MTLGVTEIDRWDPQTVRDVAAAAAGRARAAELAADTLAALPAFADWDGRAADAARISVAATRAELDAHAEQARAVARAAGRAAEAIAAIKTELGRLEEAAHAEFLDIDHHSGAVMAGPGFRGGRAEYEAGAAVIAGRLAAIVSAANTVDTQLAQAITLGNPLSPAPRTPAEPDPAPPALPPEGIRRWWESLSAAERAARLAADPQRYGALDGIPAADRDTANRILLTADLQDVADSVRHANAVQVEKMLAAGPAPTLLLVYQPTAFGGQGRAAVAIGNPDTAGDTAVVVPGTGSSVTHGWLENGEAGRLYTELQRAEPNAEHSVIAWMGYDAPDRMADPRVTQPALARAGGALLAADVKALTATHVGHGHLTVIGHSYGATTVADAAAGSGMRADDVVLVGCPGTDQARTAADFHLPVGGHVYVGSASTDPVNLIAGVNGTVPVTGQPTTEVGLGADPAADGYGSTRFEAEVPGLTFDDHSHYFDDGSESLYSMADIASGHGALLEQHGMTAPHRAAALGSLATRLGLPNWSVPALDPEFGRLGTSGNYHEPIE